jgi:phytoene/squalene synthetase
MTALRPDRPTSERPATDKPATDRPTAEKLGDIVQAAPEFEGQIREFIRRDVTGRRRAREEATDPGVENVNLLIERVAGQTVAEIDRVVSELNGMRDMLRREGDRVQRELTGYAGLSQSALMSMKIISESLAQWKPNSLAQPSDAG